MFYTRDISVEANTPRNSAKTVNIKTTAGVVHQVGIMFPDGCAGLVHVQLWHGGHPFIPVDPMMDVAGNNETVNITEFYKLFPGFNIITVRVWNEDDTHSHTIRVRIGVLPEYILVPYKPLTTISNRMAKLLRRIGVF